MLFVWFWGFLGFVYGFYVSLFGLLFGLVLTDVRYFVRFVLYSFIMFYFCFVLGLWDELDWLGFCFFYSGLFLFGVNFVGCCIDANMFLCCVYYLISLKVRLRIECFNVIMFLGMGFL